MGRRLGPTLPSQRSSSASAASYPAAVAIVKIAASVAVIASGFRAVSDDDFARVVIAEEWARAPRWDATGTSWLPFPFWVHGAAMMVFGRGLGTARATAFLIGVAASILVYLAARWLGEDRRPAAIGAGLAAVFPWSARLGVATVPEIGTAALTLIGIAAIASPKDTDRDTRLLWGGAALAAASLSRYEAWPVAATFAALGSIEAVRSRRAVPSIAAAIALLGPALWLLWNRLAHADALHFLARVAAYKQALGGTDAGAASRLFAYPLAMVREEPEIAAIAITGAALLVGREGRDKLRETLGKYALPAVMIAIQIAALSLAMIKDGAPTHHPERAVLCGLLLVAVIAGATASRMARIEQGVMIAVIVVLTSIGVRSRLPREPFSARADEEAAGRAAGAIAKPGDRVLVEVADYGYLAVTAAHGRPEDVIRDRSVDPRDPKQPSSFTDREAIAHRMSTSGARFVVAKVTTPAREALGEPVTTHGAWGVFRARGAE